LSAVAGHFPTRNEEQNMKPLPVILGFVAILAAVGVISWMSQPRASQPVISKEQLPDADNPFKIPESGPHPKAVLEEEIYNFGKMMLGETGSHAFVIRNEGEAPLKLKKGVVLCKCTVPDIPGGEIAPGESVEVVLEWKPEGTTDSFDKYAEIWTNDPENEKLRLTVTGEVRTLVRVEPPAPWTVTSVREDEPTAFNGVIASGQDAFQIVSIEKNAEWLSLEARPLEAGELEELGEGMASGYLLSGTIRPEMPVGRFEEKVVIKTDLKNHVDEDYSLELVVNGTRPGPFSIIGRAWFGRQMTVAMEKVEATEGKSVTVSMFTPPEEEPLQFTSVTSRPDIVTVELKRDETFPTTAKKEKYDLTFTIPAGSRLGHYSQNDKIAVTLETNRESLPRIELSVDATVE
jgi:hypothetical protein